MADTVGDLRGGNGADRQREARQLALLPEDADVAEAEIERARGPGRPSGAVNRATRQMRDYILKNFSDPAVGLAVTGLRSGLQASLEAAIAIAGTLGCKPIEALDLMRKCSVDLMPYVHSKQPLAVQLTGRIAQLHIGLGQAPERLAGDGLAELLDEFARGQVLELEDLSDLENVEETSG
jgi:hypothetical protein